VKSIKSVIFDDLIFRGFYVENLILGFMTKSEDLRWRAIVFSEVYGISDLNISLLLGVHLQTIYNWKKTFRQEGSIMPKRTRTPTPRYPAEVFEFITQYTLDHPCFYVEELKSELKTVFPHISNFSDSTLCRCLRFDCGLSRKVLTKRAKEASLEEITNYLCKIKYYMNNVDQLVFIDETSKDGRSATRRFAWSKIGIPAIVRNPFTRGKRVSILGAVDINGYFGWGMTDGTFDREKIHAIMIDKIIPYLNPYPLPRSIIIMDNAKVHMYQKLINAIHEAGAIVIFLPPYCPQFNPIEYCFSLLKRWIQKKASNIFPKFPSKVAEIALKDCTNINWMRKGLRGRDLFPENPNGIREKELAKEFKRHGNLRKLFAHCGYGETNFIIDKFNLK
jgi:hypothetical protein